jgi:hypothetical protein
LQKDALVLVLPSHVPSNTASLLQLLRTPKLSYCLAVVLSGPNRGGGGGGGRGATDGDNRQTILALRGALPDSDNGKQAWVCVPVSTLTVSIREWCVGQ